MRARHLSRKQSVMTPKSSNDHQAPNFPTSVVREDAIEYGFIGTLQKLKYEYRRDITDRATLEANFREKFEALNRVNLTDGEFTRLLDEIVTPDVYTASKLLRQINAFKTHKKRLNAAAFPIPGGG